MTIFVLGGSKSGKSEYAQNLAVSLRPVQKPLYYLATMIPTGAEDAARIQKHRESRLGLGFTTLEYPFDILPACKQEAGVLLADSLTAYLQNQMFAKENPVPNLEEEIASSLQKLSLSHFHLIVVSDYLFSDSCINTAETELYRRTLGKIHQRIAEQFDQVFLFLHGVPIVLKGSEKREDSRICAL